MGFWQPSRTRSDVGKNFSPPIDPTVSASTTVSTISLVNPVLGQPVAAMDLDTPPGVAPPGQEDSLPKNGKSVPLHGPHGSEERDGDATPNTVDTGAASANPASTSVNPSASASSGGATSGDRKNSDAKKQRREAQAAEYKAIYEKVRLSLWPTKEAEKQLMSKSQVTSIEYRRLWDSFRFRDAWKDFSAKKVPSSKDRDLIRDLAVSILAKKKGGAHKGKSGSKTPEQKGEKTSGNQNSQDKRKRDSSASSSSSSTGGIKQPFKIPKVHPDAPTKESAPVKEPGSAEGMDTTNPTEETGIVEGEEEYGSLLSFTPDMGAALSNTGYAATAGGKKARLDYPHLLYIHAGHELREKIPRAAWKIFLEKFNERLVDMTIEDKDTPDIDWTGYKAGTGVIATVDYGSQKIAKEVISTIEVAELKFSGWPKGAKDSKMLVTIKVPTEFKNVPSGKLVQALAKKNDLQESGWKIYTTTAINKDSGERILRLIVDEMNFAIIKDKTGVLQIGARKLEVFHKNRKVM